MKTCSICLTLGLLAVAQIANSQTFAFEEVRTNLLQTVNAVPITVTDSGDVLLVEFSPPFAAFFVHKGSLHPVATQPYDTINYGNDFHTVVGYDIYGNGFVQDARGNRTILTGANGDTLYPSGINNKGVIAVTDSVAGGSFLEMNGVLTSVPLIGNYGISNLNDFNDVCGSGYTSQPVCYETRGPVLLNFTVPGYGFYSNAVNTRGQVVGNTNVNYTPLGFVFSPIGNVQIIDGSQFGPPAMPGTKGPMLLNKVSLPTQVWGENNLGAIAGISFLDYRDEISDYQFNFPFVGIPASKGI